jgi:hypothetical protein
MAEVARERGDARVLSITMTAPAQRASRARRRVSPQTVGNFLTSVGEGC